MRKLLLALLVACLPSLGVAQDIVNPQTDQSRLILNKGQLPGTTTNDDAAAGAVGEFKSSFTTRTSTSGTAIVSVAAPAIVTWSGHGLNIGSGISLSGGGTFPTGLAIATNYYVCSASFTANSFALSSSVSNALAGTCITGTGTTSGAQTVSSTIVLTNSTVVDITGIQLTAGDWDVWGGISATGEAATTVTYIGGSITTSEATYNTTIGSFSQQTYGGATAFASVSVNFGVPVLRVTVASPTNVYLNTKESFGTATANSGGFLKARRVR